MFMVPQMGRMDGWVFFVACLYPAFNSSGSIVPGTFWLKKAANTVVQSKN